MVAEAERTINDRGVTDDVGRGVRQVSGGSQAQPGAEHGGWSTGEGWTMFRTVTVVKMGHTQ